MGFAERVRRLFGPKTGRRESHPLHEDACADLAVESEGETEFDGGQASDVPQPPSQRLTPEVAAVVLSTSKFGEPAEFNADAGSADVETLRFGIADGASRSYNPGPWARRLVETTTIDDLDRDPEGFLSRAVEGMEYPSPDSMRWNMAALFEAGAHTTLLLAEIHSADAGVDLRLRSIGDCVAVLEHIDDQGGLATRSWPFERIADFPVGPDTLRTTAQHVNGTIRSLNVEAEQLSRLLLMTDAIGRYVVAGLEAGKGLDALLPFLADPTQQAFDEWVDEARSLKRLDDDDTTIVVVSFFRPSART